MASESKSDRLERIAEILIDAYISRDDRKTAERYGITDRTLRNWRKQLETDAELSALFREKKSRASEGWANEVPGALRAAVGFIRTAAEKGDPTDPAMLHSVAGAMKLLSEVSATWKLLDARMARSAGQDGAAAGQAAARPTLVRSAG
jgi:transposase-like protein